jgi:hypothetical protein
MHKANIYVTNHNDGQMVYIALCSLSNQHACYLKVKLHIYFSVEILFSLKLCSLFCTV